MNRLAAWLELRVPPVVVVLVMMVAMRVCVRWSPPMPVPAHAADPLGTVLMIAGALVATAGALQFHRHETTVDPMHPDRATRLVERGVFAVSRNPMYVGFVVILIGAALALNALMALLGPLLLAVWLHRFQIQPEERFLRRQFGAAFDDYCRRVPRWLGVPRA